MITKKQRTYRRTPGRTRYTKAYVARIARSVVQRNEETKCFTQALATNANGTTSWAFASALAGLTQGTSTSTRVGSRIQIVALEYFVKIAPATANMGGEGSMCRMIFYHNKAAGAATPSVSEYFDSNTFSSGRNINYVKKYTTLEDITHQMVITATPGTAATFAAGPAFFRIVRIPLRTFVEYAGNAGTISDLPVHDFGIGYAADDTNCCLVNVTSKVWFKDA